MTRQTVLPALLLVCTAAAAQAQTTADTVDARVGPYVAGAIGRSHYEHTCWYFSTCDSSRATTGRLAAGYRFGLVAVEASWTDFGEGRNDFSGGTQHLRALGLSAVFLVRWGGSLEGLLRVGAASVEDTRSQRGVTTRATRTQPTFGLGLGWTLSPAMSVQLGWDVTRGDTGNSSSSGNDSTVLVNAPSIGLRIRF